MVVVDIDRLVEIEPRKAANNQAHHVLVWLHLKLLYKILHQHHLCMHSVNHYNTPKLHWSVTPQNEGANGHL